MDGMTRVVGWKGESGCRGHTQPLTCIGASTTSTSDHAGLSQVAPNNQALQILLLVLCLRYPACEMVPGAPLFAARGDMLAYEWCLRKARALDKVMC